MNIKEKLNWINKSGWPGMKYSTYREELRKSYKLLDFFIDNVVDDYLNQNETTVLHSLEEDNPPKEFVNELLEQEKNNKNRKKIIKWLNQSQT